jgi:hypothetical protein
VFLNIRQSLKEGQETSWMNLAFILTQPASGSPRYNDVFDRCFTLIECPADISHEHVKTYLHYLALFEVQAAIACLSFGCVQPFL